MATTNTNTTDNVIREPICDGYEWVQYNQRLRIIHSINDDMYQMKSIVEALRPPVIREPRRWLDLDSTKELLVGFEEMIKNEGKTLNGNIAVLQNQPKIVENRMHLAPGVRGYYCHRLLVNLFAAWVNPRYAYFIAKLLDELFAKERDVLVNKIHEQKPRMVPQHKEKSYKYMIWKEELPDDPDMILLHLVRRNNRAFSQVSNIRNDEDKCWFYRESLPIAMTPNEDVKQIVKQNLPGSEYNINGCTIETYKEHLPLLHEKITEYFDGFQE